VTASSDDASVAARVKLVLLLGGIAAFLPLSIDMYVPGLPRLTHDFDTSASTVQLTLTAFMIGAALGQLLAGPLSDVVGRRRPLLAGTACYSAISLACAFAPDVHVFTVLRLAQGVTGAAGAVIARTIVRDLYTGAAASRYFSRLMLVNGLAPILAPVIGGQILRVTSWRAIFAVLAAIGVTMFFAALLGLRETLPRERRRHGGAGETGQTAIRLLRDRPFVGYAATQSAATAAMFAYIAGSSFVLQGIYGVSAATYGLLFGVNALGLVVCSQVNGHLVARHEPRALLGVGRLLGLFGGLLLLGVVLAGGIGLWGILPALFLVVSSQGFTGPNSMALALAPYPDAAGVGAALLGVSSMLLGAVVAPLVGIAGRDTAVPLAIVVCTLELGAFFALRLAGSSRPAQRPASAEVAEFASVDA
jgi:DHA1 family bicyclomycin/chloramphenicol resistance-like MFS transporter